MRRFSLILFLAIIAICLTVPSTFARSLQPAAQPSTQPAAQALIDQVRDAYANLKSLELAGTFTLDADVAQQTRHDSSSFTAQFQAPTKFRHEMKDDVVLVGTGEKLFSYLVPRNLYMTGEQPKERTSDLAAELGDLLREQNPSLLFAVSKDAGEEISSDATSIEKTADVNLDGKSFSALKLMHSDREITMLIDPQTGLLRQMKVDVRKMFEQQQVPQVKTAIVTIDYTTTTPNASIDAAKFAFVPPAGATLVDEKTAMAAAAGGGPDDPADEPAMALVGKPAPAVKLENLDGKETSPLVEDKGSVIVLDFWATWCPPCREGLPHLAELYKDKQAAGLKVFAVNQREDKDKVQKFLVEQKLELHVLLDYNGAVGAAYQVSGIPQTVVIGKDGAVRNVFVGFGPDSAEQLAKAVDAAMKAK